MILPIILHHNTSAVYTQKIELALQHTGVIVYDSSEYKTAFTASFNRAIEIYKREQVNNPAYTHVMICNNDIDLRAEQFGALEKIIGSASGIFTPVVNSPHHKVMSKQSDKEMDEVPCIEFICPVISNDVLKDVGFLDAGLTLGWGIDMDYSYRAKLKGYRSMVVNHISVHHYGNKSQESPLAYGNKANMEMNHILKLKYGADWRQLLKYPQHD